MNNIITSREDILKNSCMLIAQNGFNNFNVRAVATSSGISIGTIYNYFGSKTDLLTETVHAIWSDILSGMKDKEISNNLETFIVWLFNCVEYGHHKYPGFIENHSAVFTEEKNEHAKDLMNKSLSQILSQLCQIMKKDPKIRKDAFNEDFTAEKFSHLLLSMFFSMALNYNYDAKMMLELVKRVLY